MVKIKNLIKKYNDKEVLKGISFEVKKGEILGFLGPNGAGKTTTMKIITGFMAPTKGKVEIDGKSMEKNALRIKRKIGYLTENNPLYDDMFVYDFLKFIARLKQIKDKKIEEEISRVEKACGLEDVILKPIGELSKGFRQRVGLAQALLGDPKVLILDEPTSGLDPNQIVEIRNLIKKIGKEKTVIFSTHILSEAKEVCDRILIIRQGEIVASGTPEELTAKSNKETLIYVKIKGNKEKVFSEIKKISELEKVKIKDKESNDIYGYEITPQEGKDIREKLSSTIMKNDWSILEFKKEEKSLEDVFRELTK